MVGATVVQDSRLLYSWVTVDADTVPIADQQAGRLQVKSGQDRRKSRHVEIGQGQKVGDGRMKKLTRPTISLPSPTHSFDTLTMELINDRNIDIGTWLPESY